MAKLECHHERTMACLEMTEAHLECKEPTMEEMDSEAEHQEVPKERATVKTGKAPSKRHKGQNLAARCCGKRKVLTRGDCGSRRKSTTTTCRKVSCRAIVAWCKRNIIRNKWTRPKVQQATWRIGPLRKNLQTHHEGRRGKKNLDGKWPPYLRNKRATAIGIGGWSSGQLSPLGRGGPMYKTLEKTLELEFVKRANGMASRLLKVRNWTLYRG
jgi:hypothetical protein